jgi:hypothetical protein
MPYAVTTPQGHVVRLDDVPLEDLHRIAVANDLESWSELLITPLRHGAAAIDLYRFCCEHTGDTPPEKLTPKLLVGAVKYEDEDLPDAWQGGLPKAEDGTSTSGSSGAPNDSTGPRTSSDDSPTET